MTQYTFAIGKYHGKNIQTELAKDLAAARRSVMTDLELKKESATKKGRAGSAILSVGCAIFAVVWKLTREQAASNTLLAVAIAFLLVGVYLLYWNLRSDYHEYMKKAAQLLMSLNSVDSARHPCVRFTDGEMTISGGSCFALELTLASRTLHAYARDSGEQTMQDCGTLQLAPGAPVRLQVFLDRCSAEIFADGKCLSVNVFDTAPLRPVSLIPQGGTLPLQLLQVWQLQHVMEPQT